MADRTTTPHAHAKQLHDEMKGRGKEAAAPFAKLKEITGHLARQYKPKKK